MKPGRPTLSGLLVAAIMIGLASIGAAQPQPAADVKLTPEEMRDFLLNARIVQLKWLSKGISNSRRATLSNGRLTHDAHVQVIDESKMVFQGARGTELNFKDSYRFNVAAYRLAVLLGLDSVPMSVERNVRGQSAAVTWWIDDVMMDEGTRHKKQAWGPDRSRTASQLHVMRVFDELISNTDRNAGNLLWTTDWKMWMIDHTRAFRLESVPKNPQRLERCERELLEKLRGLTREAVQRELGAEVGEAAVRALLERRDHIVKRFDDLIAKRGESVVLYTLSR